mgnify:CR=1 FL=1
MPVSPDTGEGGGAGAGEPLAAVLSRRIAATGPVSVHDYMEAANRAYYAGGTAIGAAGDFVTAPEVSQMFGEMAGLWLADLWLRAGSPGDAIYAELGPGRGTLAADALRAAGQFGLKPPVHLVETSPRFRAAQSELLPGARFHDSATWLPAAPTLLVANEFFDALPIRQAILTYAGWRERVVVRGEMGRFAALAGTQAVQPPVPARLACPPGSIFEWRPAATATMMKLTHQVVRHGGALLVIDYGQDGPRTGDTLQAVERHRRADPFAEPGTRDLTAHVDFAALAEAARGAGGAVSGPVGQGDWLCRLGIDARLDALAHANPERATGLRADRNRLVDPDQMGELFRVMAVTAPGWPLPEGFA